MTTIQLSSGFGLIAGGMGLYMIVFFAFFIFIAVTVVSTLAVVPRIKRAMAAVSANPCEQTAQALAKVLHGLNGIQRFLLSQANGLNGGVSKVACAHIYNQLVAGHPAISMETKNLLLRGLVGIGCTTLQGPRATMSPEQQRAANEEQGRLGEENVAHALRALGDFGAYQVFRNVYLENSGGDCKENDFIVVGPTGIFLLEVKSNRGRYANGTHYIDLSSLDRDPTGQMLQHEGAMRRTLSSLEGAGDHIRNMLVISYPNGERPPVVDLASFPAHFNACTVDSLLHVIVHSAVDPFMTPERIHAVCERIRSNLK